jgi:hypothetical protein
MRRPDFEVKKTRSELHDKSVVRSPPGIVEKKKTGRWRGSAGHAYPAADATRFA